MLNVIKKMFLQEKNAFITNNAIKLLENTVLKQSGQVKIPSVKISDWTSQL